MQEAQLVDRKVRDNCYCEACKEATTQTFLIFKDGKKETRVIYCTTCYEIKVYIPDGISRSLR